MKNNSIQIVFFVILISLFYTDILSAQSAPHQSVLEFKGHLYNDEDNRAEKVVVEFYQNKKLVKKMRTKNNGKFQFVLFKHNDYKVRIIKEGFVKEYIVVKTKDTKDFSSKKYLFEFSLYLKSLEKYKTSGVTEFDFPSAKVGYSLEDDEYIHDKHYQKMVKSKLAKLE